MPLERYVFFGRMVEGQATYSRIVQTTEDVKVKTRTGAFRKFTLLLGLPHIVMCSSHTHFRMYHTCVHNHRVFRLPTSGSRHFHCGGQKPRPKTERTA